MFYKNSTFKQVYLPNINDPPVNHRNKGNVIPSPQAGKKGFAASK